MAKGLGLPFAQIKSIQYGWKRHFKAKDRFVVNHLQSRTRTLTLSIQHPAARPHSSDLVDDCRPWKSDWKSVLFQSLQS